MDMKENKQNRLRFFKDVWNFHMLALLMYRHLDKDFSLNGRHFRCTGGTGAPFSPNTAERFKS